MYLKGMDISEVQLFHILDPRRKLAMISPEIKYNIWGVTSNEEILDLLWSKYEKIDIRFNPHLIFYNHRTRKYTSDIDPNNIRIAGAVRLARDILWILPQINNKDEKSYLEYLYNQIRDRQSRILNSNVIISPSLDNISK